MSNSKQQSVTVPAPKTRANTLSGKLAKMAAASAKNDQPATEGDTVTMNQLVFLLEKQRSDLKEDVSALIQTSTQSLQSSVSALRDQVNDFNGRLTQTESVAGENFERISIAEATIKSLQSQNTGLLGRLDDLENRSRRSNLRIVNVPEGSENGKDPVKFISEMLMDIMGPDVFAKPPTLERAHRSLGPKPTQGASARPRTFMVCFHRFQEKERALRWARQHELKYHGTVLRVYPDLSTALAKRRAAFNAVKQSLYQKGVRFQLLYPARLRVMFGEDTRHFETPEEAKAFYDQRIATGVA